MLGKDCGDQSLSVTSFYSWSVTIPRRRTFMARSYRRL